MNHKHMNCEGCNRSFRKSSIVWFLGHYLCGSCKRRQNMPLVGYKNREVWKKAEAKIFKKKRKIPYLTYNEKTYLYKEYTKKGISYPDIKKRFRIINSQLVKNWNKDNEQASTKKT